VIWNYAYTPHLWPSAITALFLLALAAYSWHRRSVPGAIPLTIACLFAAAWATGSVLDYAALDPATKITWVKLQSCAQAPIVIATTCFILEYAWPGRWLTRRNMFILMILPVVFVGLALTNDFHHLAWAGFQMNDYGFTQPLLGPVPLISTVTFLPMFEVINLIVFGWLFLHSPQHRWPVVLIVLGQSVGRTLYTLVKIGVFQPILPLEFFGMGFEFLMYAIALFGLRILDPIPTARNMVIEQLHAGMLVLDNQTNLASLNPAAATILGTTAKLARGKPIRDLLPAYPAGPFKELTETELSLGVGGEVRDYVLTISKLKDFRGLQAGYLVMLRDITEQKQTQAQILEQQRALATLQERERVARELHDGIGQVLGYVKMQAQAARDRLAQGQTAEADECLVQLISVAHDAHADVREYILGAKTTASGQPGFLAALRQYLLRFSEIYGMHARLVEPSGWDDDLLEPTVAAQLLRIIQEALTNVRKHAQATCVQVIIRLDGACAQVIVQDDGVGFDPVLLSDEIGQKYGLGFLRERAAEVGGSVAIHSAPAQGTRVVVDVPRRRHANSVG
jgi:PAS domain S-box-containing protein